MTFPPPISPRPDLSTACARLVTTGGHPPAPHGGPVPLSDMPPATPSGPLAPLDALRQPAPDAASAADFGAPNGAADRVRRRSRKVDPWIAAGLTPVERTGTVARLRRPGLLLNRGRPKLDMQNPALKDELLRIRIKLRPAPLPAAVPAPEASAGPARPSSALPTMDGFLASRGILPHDAGRPERALEFLALQKRPGMRVGHAGPLACPEAVMGVLDGLPGRPHLVLCVPLSPAYLEVWRDPAGVWRAQSLLAAGERPPPVILLLLLTRLFEQPLPASAITIVALPD